MSFKVDAAVSIAKGCVSCTSDIIIFASVISIFVIGSLGCAKVIPNPAFSWTLMGVSAASIAATILALIIKADVTLRDKQKQRKQKIKDMAPSVIATLVFVSVGSAYMTLSSLGLAHLLSARTIGIATTSIHGGVFLALPLTLCCCGVGICCIEGCFGDDQVNDSSDLNAPDGVK